MDMEGMNKKTIELARNAVKEYERQNEDRKGCLH
jgi:hypothetical protein